MLLREGLQMPSCPILEIFFSPSPFFPATLASLKDCVCTIPPTRCHLSTTLDSITRIRCLQLNNNCLFQNSFTGKLTVARAFRHTCLYLSEHTIIQAYAILVQLPAFNFFFSLSLFFKDPCFWNEAQTLEAFIYRGSKSQD